MNDYDLVSGDVLFFRHKSQLFVLVIGMLKEETAIIVLPSGEVGTFLLMGHDGRSPWNENGSWKRLA